MAFFAASVEFRMQVQGIAPIRRQLRGVIQHSEDWGPALEQIAQRFRTHMHEVFASEGAATRSGQWAPLSQRYAAWKAVHYPGMPALQRRSRLAASLIDKGSAGHVEEISSHNLTIGSSLTTPNGRWNLGLIHQMGRKDGSIPARKIIDPPEREIAAWLGLLRAHIWSER